MHTAIKEALKEDKLIFFVGSGFSRELGMPDWKGLLSLILDELIPDYEFCDFLKKGLELEVMDVLEVLDKLKEKGLKSEVLRKLDNVFQVGENTKESLRVKENKYNKITKISNKIITTNYDEIIELANPHLTRVNNDNIIRVSDIPNINKYIFKIHGSIEYPSKCILFRDDYEELYNQESFAVNELRKLIADNTIIFLGFSLEDKYVKKQLEYIQLLYKGFKGKHFIVTTNKKENIYGTENIYLENWEKVDEFLAALIEIKSSYLQTSTVVEQVTSSNSDSYDDRKEKVATPQISILYSDPIDRDSSFEKGRLIKPFKNYNVDVKLDVLSINKLNNIENIDYLIIFTEFYNNKVLVEDEFMNSKFISLERFEEEIFQENLKAIIIYTNKLPSNLTNLNLNHPYVIGKFDDQNISSNIFKLLRKTKLPIEDKEHILINHENIDLINIERGKYKLDEKNSILSDGLDYKNHVNFIGRKTDLEIISRKCIDLDGRILSIKASGGIGKTTIIKKLAYEFSRRYYYKDGISFVDCEHIGDFKTFEYRISKCFGIESTTSLSEYLMINNIKKDILLILDNFESLLYLSNNEDTLLIKQLLSIICDFCSVVITTRELLEVEYEESYELRTLTTDEAESLFYTKFRSKITDYERKVLRKSILENLLNNNPLAIKIVISNLPEGKDMIVLKEELENDFFNTTKLDYEDIFDEKTDINIERTRSIFNSINYSYTKLKHKEQLVFELLAIFPDGINMTNFKKFFQSEDFKRDINKVTDKEIKSLENKSLIQVSNGIIKLQSIVGRFASYRFNNRTNMEKKSYYKRAFEYNNFLLEAINSFYRKREHEDSFVWNKYLKTLDNYTNNFIQCIKSLDFVEVDKYDSLDFIISVCEILLSLELPPITDVLEDVIDIYKDIENSELLIDIIILKSRYYAGDFENVIVELNEKLPLENILELYSGENTNEDITKRLICDYALNIYSYKEELKVLKLVMKYKYPIERTELVNILFKLSINNQNIEVENKGFFYFESQLRNGCLNLEEVNNYINNLYEKEFSEILQNNYIKAKVNKISREEVKVLVTVNPYTNGLKKLMLAFLEEDFNKAYNLYMTALSQLKHISYYYLEAIFYFSKFLKEFKHADFDKWFDYGLRESTRNGYQALVDSFCQISDNINITVNHEIDEKELKIYIDSLPVKNKS